MVHKSGFSYREKRLGELRLGRFKPSFKGTEVVFCVTKALADLHVLHELAGGFLQILVDLRISAELAPGAIHSTDSSIWMHTLYLDT
ncbi:hypothetical protein HUJ05_006500 [Dendroctonus ponderosae]|nr:hypothetical protein HUJ05_006500 [Dendroctonus ponderosae]